MIVCDTGPLVAAADRDDQDNRACTDLLTGLHLARRPILVPAPVVAEVGYLLARAGGAKIEAAFLRSVVAQTVTIVDLELADYARMVGDDAGRCIKLLRDAGRITKWMGVDHINFPTWTAIDHDD